MIQHRISGRANRSSRINGLSKDSCSPKRRTKARRDECRNGTTKFQSGTFAFYEQNAQNFCGATAQLNLNKLYAPFLKHMPPAGHILDAGCGSGRDTKAFLAKGYEVTAIDWSPRVAQIAKRLTHQECKVMSFDEINFREQFDGIWACASLLHIPHSKCYGILKRFANALRPGGVLFVSLKEGHGNEIAQDGRFFSYYNIKEFSNLLTHAGLFVVVDAWKSKALDSAGTMKSWLNVIARKR